MADMVITRRYTFSAAHQIMGHPKCGRIHGHNYVVTVGLKCDVLDMDKGMVLDYGEMDDDLKPIINEADHMYILSRDSMFSEYALIAAQQGETCSWDIPFSTAECIAKYLFDRFDKLYAGFEYSVAFVEVQETEKSTARYAGC